MLTSHRRARSSFRPALDVLPLRLAPTIFAPTPTPVYEAIPPSCEVGTETFAPIEQPAPPVRATEPIVVWSTIVYDPIAPSCP